MIELKAQMGELEDQRKNLEESFAIAVSDKIKTEAEMGRVQQQLQSSEERLADLEKSMDWYGENLYFSRDTVMSFPGYGVTVGMMHQGDFYLEFVQFEKDLSPTKLNFPPGSSALNGFFIQR